MPVFHRTVPLTAAFFFAVAALASGCGAGSCEASGGIVDECKDGWTRDECDEWDDIEVNGAGWEYSGKSCEDLGYDVECDDGSWVNRAADC